MQIERDSVVVFHYRLSEEGGEEMESSHGGDPIAALQGHGNIIAGLDAGLVGKSEGDVFSVTVRPEQAYGVRREDASQRIPIKHLTVHDRKKLKPGMTVGVNTEKGVRHVVVSKVGRFNVDVDTNHPLAGKTLVFDIEIVTVRAASEEELSHGHVHGVGGHAH